MADGINAGEGTMDRAIEEINLDEGLGRIIQSEFLLLIIIWSIISVRRKVRCGMELMNPPAWGF